MNKKTAFIGHRKVFFVKEVKERLFSVLEEQIKSGCKDFIMGTHGEFDAMALSVCREKRKVYSGINIDVVLTSYHKIEKKTGFDHISYRDVNTIMFDIEEEHYKRRITASNRKMIDECDTLICYVDIKYEPSGAKTAMKYAQKKGLKIINIFKEEDDPTFGMSEEQRKIYWNNRFARVCGSE